MSDAFCRGSRHRLIAPLFACRQKWAAKCTSPRFERATMTFYKKNRPRRDLFNPFDPHSEARRKFSVNAFASVPIWSEQKGS